MYLPYLRAKKTDLSAIIELKDIFSTIDNLVPIIEPVANINKANKNDYKKLVKHNIPFILVVNPRVGEVRRIDIQRELINDVLDAYANLTLGYIITTSTTSVQIQNFISAYPNHRHAFIHFEEFNNPRQLFGIIASDSNNDFNIFIDSKVTLPYINTICNDNSKDVLIRDGFQRKKRNADYPNDSTYYNLHNEYHDLGYDGFGDFTIMGEKYSDTGGPASVVAIHLTDTLTPDIIIRHFLSDTTPPLTTTNPGRKFIEALNKLKLHLNVSPHLNTLGVADYNNLYLRSHFPGLPMVKKISIKHHIEYVHSLV